MCKLSLPGTICLVGGVHKSMHFVVGPSLSLSAVQTAIKQNKNYVQLLVDLLLCFRSNVVSWSWITKQR